MSEPDFSSIVIDRLARIETGITSMNDKLDKLAADDAIHRDKIADHDSRLLLLESRRDTGKTVLTILVACVAVAAFVLTILDRLYQ